MKIIFSLIALVFANDSWTEWKIKYGKKYTSDAEEVFRKNIFDKNQEVVNIHNDNFDKNLISFAKGLNKFSDWTDDERASYLNRGIRKQIQTF
jgi:hypothetical protein